MYVSLNDLNLWCDSRDTSAEIAQEIFAIAETDVVADAIWADPEAHGVDPDALVARAWKRADDAETRLFWGLNKYTRGQYQLPEDITINVVDDDDETVIYEGGLNQFFLDNEDAIDRPEAVDIATELHASGDAYVGGGAAPLYRITKEA